MKITLFVYSAWPVNVHILYILLKLWIVGIRKYTYLSVNCLFYVWVKVKEIESLSQTVIFQSLKSLQPNPVDLRFFKLWVLIHERI